MASKVNIEINAIDKASGILQTIVGSITNGANALDLIAAAAAAATSIVRDSIESFANYSEEVKNFSRITGTSAEESSRLIQISDDVRISFESLTTAARQAAKNGISLTVEEVKRLSAEYLSLQPGAERANFLIETFGRSGLEMGKLLEQGASGIDKLNEGINENLILTKRAIADAESYKRNVDALNDSWEGFKMVLGQEVVPALNDMLIGFNNTNTIRERANQLIEEGIAKNREEALSIAAAEVQQYEMNQSMIEGEGAANAYNAALGIVTTTLQDFQLASQEVSKENTTFISLIQSVAKETENYEAKQGDLISKLKELREEQSKYTEGGKKYQEVQSEIDAVTAKMEENAAAHSAATNTIIFNLLQQRLAIGGLSDAESEFLIQQGVNLGIFDEQTAQMAQSYMDTAAQLEQSFVNTNTIGTNSFTSLSVSMGVATSSMSASTGSMTTAVTTATNTIQNNFGTVIPAIIQNAQNLFAGGIGGIILILNGWVTEIQSTLISLKQKFAAEFDQMIKKAVSIIERAQDTLVQAIIELISMAKSALKPLNIIVNLPDFESLAREIGEGMALLNAALNGGKSKGAKGSNTMGGGGGISFARAMGGRIDAGTPTLVGERGAEIFVPDTGGRIIPNYKLGASSGGNIIVNLTYAPAFSTVDQYELQERLTPFIERGIRNVQRGTA